MIGNPRHDGMIENSNFPYYRFTRARARRRNRATCSFPSFRHAPLVRSPGGGSENSTAPAGQRRPQFAARIRKTSEWELAATAAVRAGTGDERNKSALERHGTICRTVRQNGERGRRRKTRPW